MLNCDREIKAKRNDTYNILIVEDAKFINNNIERILARLDYKCDQAYDFHEAKSSIDAKEYDYILLDLNLPDGFGVSMVQEIIKLSSAKIIVLTAETDVELREELYKLGILDYIVKDKYFNDSVEGIDTTIKSLELNMASNILVIDDSRFLQTYIGNVLSIRNYNILSAYTAQEGGDFSKLKCELDYFRYGASRC